MDDSRLEHHLTSPQGRAHRPDGCATASAGGGSCCDTLTVSVALRGDYHVARATGDIVLHRKDAPVTTLDEETWHEVLDVNLKGVFLGCKFAVPAIIAAYALNGRGSPPSGGQIQS